MKQINQTKTKTYQAFHSFLMTQLKQIKKVAHECFTEAKCKIRTIKIKRSLMSINKSFKQTTFLGC